MDKPVCKTHPFIRYTIDLSKISATTWLLIGEVASKIEHIASSSLDPAVSREMHTVMLVRGVLGTTAIEGNTLSEGEVRQIIDQTLELPKSKRYLQTEVENIVQACNDVLNQMEEGASPEIDTAWLNHQNALVLRGLSLPDEVVPGRYREHKVGVARYSAPSPEHVPPLMRRLFAWLKELSDEAAKLPEYERAIQLLRAILGHLYIAWIHPFGDGNGRSARLLEHTLLLIAGVPSPCAHLFSNHYNQTRQEYYRQLDLASRTGDPHAFIRYSLEGFHDGLREQVGRIQRYQLQVAWKDYVWNELDPKTIAQKRQCRLCFAIAERGIVTRREVLELPGLARRYLGTGPRTLARDINRVIKIGLVEKRGALLRARTERIQELRPFSANEDVWR